MSEMLAIANGYGSVDVRSPLPKRYVHVPGKRLQPLCRKLGVKFAVALVGFDDTGFGYKPLTDGVVVSAAGAVKLRAAIAQRESRGRVVRTPEQRKQDKERRQERDVKRFTAAILEQFPRCPPAEAREIAEHACQIGSGRVGRSSTCGDPVRLAVVAHIRHNHTDYDVIIIRKMRAAYDDESRREAKEAAREAVDDKIDEVLTSWEADTK